MLTSVLVALAVARLEDFVDLDIAVALNMEIIFLLVLMVQD